MNKKVELYYNSATSISLCSRKHYQKCYCEAVIITGASLVGFMKSESECMTASQIKKTTSLSRNIGFPSTINNEQETSKELPILSKFSLKFSCHVTSLSWTCQCLSMSLSILVGLVVSHCPQIRRKCVRI